MTREDHHPIRSLLFAPANEARKTRRLSGSAADAVVLDLEDAVALSEKISARTEAIAALTGIDGPLRCIRVNPLTTRFGAGDIAAVVDASLQAIVLPKVEDPRDLEIADQLLGDAEAGAGLRVGTIGLLPLVETARGIARVDSILGQTKRVVGVALGTGDLGTDLGLPTIRGDLTAALQFGREAFFYAARGAGHSTVIDGPYLNVRDLDGLREDCLRSRDLGFTGKVCIHPAQVPVVNEVFAPDRDEVEFAEKVVTAFEAAERDRSAAIEVGGVFIDYPILYKARRILDLAERLSKRASPADSNQ